tara:strand:+ start:82 stop:270 length:189 start_codon:yes stop_codon:yes gene_type:complete
MSINSELDRIASEVATQVYESVYQISAKELEYSDLEIDGDDFHEAHEILTELVFNKIKNDMK